MKHDAAEILQKAFEMGFNFRVTSFELDNCLDYTFRCDIGKKRDINNPNEADVTCFEAGVTCFNLSNNINDVIEDACNNVSGYYPDSEFSKWWREQCKK
jgi:hypothetical protein